MHRLCLNSRDQLFIIDLTKVAYFQANGNYTQLVYITGASTLLALGLSKIEEYIRRAWPAEKKSPFLRLGRSFIINQTYLTEINVLRQRLVLSDLGSNVLPVTIAKPLLKKYKENLHQYYLKSASTQEETKES